jgi:hypothetical protein
MFELKETLISKCACALFSGWTFAHTAMNMLSLDNTNGQQVCSRAQVQTRRGHIKPTRRSTRIHTLVNVARTYLYGSTWVMNADTSVTISDDTGCGQSWIKTIMKYGRYVCVHVCERESVCVCVCTCRVSFSHWGKNFLKTDVNI